MLYLQSATLQEAKLRKTRSIERLFILKQSDYLPLTLTFNFAKYQVNSLGSKRFVIMVEQKSVYIDKVSKYGSSGKLVNDSKAFERQTLILSKRCTFAIIIH